MAHSKDYIQGWHDARSCAQVRGSVPPNPPEATATKKKVAKKKVVKKTEEETG